MSSASRLYPRLAIAKLVATASGNCTRSGITSRRFRGATCLCADDDEEDPVVSAASSLASSAFPVALRKVAGISELFLVCLIGKKRG